MSPQFFHAFLLEALFQTSQQEVSGFAAMRKVEGKAKARKARAKRKARRVMKKRGRRSGEEKTARSEELVLTGVRGAAFAVRSYTGMRFDIDEPTFPVTEYKRFGISDTPYGVEVRELSRHDLTRRG